MLSAPYLRSVACRWHQKAHLASFDKKSSKMQWQWSHLNICQKSRLWRLRVPSQQPNEFGGSDCLKLKGEYYYWPLNCPGVIGSLELPLPVATETQNKMLQLCPSWPSLLVSWNPGNAGCLETDDIPSLGVVCYNSRLEGCYPNWPSLDSTIGWFLPLITTVSCAIILKICFCVTWEIKLHIFL